MAALKRVTKKSARSYQGYSVCSIQWADQSPTSRHEVCLLCTKEYNDIMSNPPEGISAGPRPGDDILPEWDAFIHGPVNTPYEGGIFHLSIKFPGDYPFKPPKVKFVTRVLHCNINGNGDVNLDILRSEWSNALTVKKVLMSFRCLLEDPNPDDPLVPDLGSLLRKDPEEYNRQVKEATLKYATPQTNSNLGNAVDS